MQVKQTPPPCGGAHVQGASGWCENAALNVLLGYVGLSCSVRSTVAGLGPTTESLFGDAVGIKLVCLVLTSSSKEQAEPFMRSGGAGHGIHA